jgi:hypothetical protein
MPMHSKCSGAIDVGSWRCNRESQQLHACSLGAWGAVMKLDLTYLERGYEANLYRRRADELRKLAAERTMSAIRLELEAEAVFCDARAKRLDDGEEPKEEPKEPIRVDKNRDLQQLDPPEVLS